MLQNSIWEFYRCKILRPRGKMPVLLLTLKKNRVSGYAIFFIYLTSTGEEYDYQCLSKNGNQNLRVGTKN